MLEIAGYVLLVLAIVAVGVLMSGLGMGGQAATNERRAEELKPFLDELAAQLEAGAPSRYQVRGRLDGVDVAITIQPGDIWFTEVTAPGRFRGVSLRLRAQRRRDAAAIARGEALDVQVGDAAFDAAYLVEGAPPDAIRALLDAEGRARVAAARFDELRLDDAGVTLTRYGGHGAVADDLACARAVAHLAARATVVFAELEAELPERGGAYRGEPDGAAAARLAADRDLARAELDGVRGAQRRRARRGEVRFVVGVAATIAALPTVTLVAGRTAGLVTLSALIAAAIVASAIAWLTRPR